MVHVYDCPTMELKRLFRTSRRRVGPGADEESATTPHVASAPPRPWEQIARADVADHPRTIDDILDRRLDGVTVTSVFSPDEVERAVAAVADTEPLRRVFPNGSVLGMPIGHIGPESQDRTEFFAAAEESRELYRVAFGFDPHDRVAAAVAPLAGGRQLQQPCEAGHEYIPGHLRWLDPEAAGLRAHADGEFGREMRHGSMSCLDSTTEIVGHLSYFVVMQRPASGGTLTVYDEAWDPDDQDVPHFDSGNRPDGWAEALPSITVDPGPGDMVVFGGGWRWHRIEPIGGPLHRITYGGFVAPSRTGRELHFWC